MRLIDADALSELLVKTYEKAPTEKALLFVALLLKNNEQVPTVELTEEQAIDKLHETGWLIRHDKEMTERPKGEWYYSIDKGWECNQCHEIVKDMPTCMRKALYNFCPNCGADMRKEKTNEYRNN